MPHPRGSFNQQDAADTPAEMAVQLRPPRSILKRLIVRPVLPSVVEPVITGEHYLHSMPGAARRCFGVYLGDRLVGAAVFTIGARQSHQVLAAARPQDVATLARLWLSDTLPLNSESRVLGIVLRSLRRTTSWKVILSYADPAAGHTGTIYRAAGWLYLGQTHSASYIRLGDGRVYHPRTVHRRYGTNGVRALRAAGIAAARERVSGKHRYAYVLDPAWRWRLRPPVHAVRRAHGDR
jgi:hypothetical protein